MNFSLKLELLVWMVFFVGVINIILVSISGQKQRPKDKLNLNIFILYYI